MRDLDDGEYDDWLRSLEMEKLLDLVKHEAQDKQLLTELAKRYSADDDFRASETFFERAIATDVNDPWTYLYFGNMEFRRRRYNAALENFRTAAELLPDCGVAFWCIADIYEAMAKYQDADRFYRKAVAIDPEDEDARYRLNRWIGLVQQEGLRF